MQKYSCIQDNSYNFTIDYRKDHLLYTDHSVWVNSTNSNSLNSSYKLKIYNGESFKEFKAIPNQSILIPYTELPTNKDLNSNSNCNFDGVYKFQLIACQDSQIMERTEAILKSVYTVYGEIVKSAINCANSEDEFQEACRILMYLQAIKIYAKENNTSKAQEYYSTLIKIFKKINCKCNGKWNMQML